MTINDNYRVSLNGISELIKKSISKTWCASLK